METINKTHKEVIVFVNTARTWLTKHTEGNVKFRYALNRVLKKLDPVISDYNDKLEDINVELCSLDAEGNVAKDQNGQYKFTKENLQKKLQRSRELFKSEVAVMSYIATEVPKDLEQDVKDAFEGFVLIETAGEV